MTQTIHAVDQLELLQSISKAQARHIAKDDTRMLFDGLLSDLLRLTASEYGFIGEVHESDGVRYLKTWAITNIAWNAENHRFYEEHAPQGLEFRNLDTLFGHVIPHRRVGGHQCTTNPSICWRHTPAGHPALRGVPRLFRLFSGDRFVGMVGIANRPAWLR